MSKEYRTKVFKSGNSVAVRLPKALGVLEGTEVNVVRESPTSFRFEPVDAPRKTIDVSGFWGKAKYLTVPALRDFDERPSTIAARKADAAE